MADMGDYTDVLLNAKGEFVTPYTKGALIPPGHYVKAATDSVIELLRAGKATIDKDGKVTTASWSYPGDPLADVLAVVELSVTKCGRVPANPFPPDYKVIDGRLTCFCRCGERAIENKIVCPKCYAAIMNVYSKTTLAGINARLAAEDLPLLEKLPDGNK